MPMFLLGLLAVALLYGAGPVHADTIDSIRARANQGDATAQDHLALLYRDGLGVRQDYQAALKWYRKAAAQGNAAAQSDLREMYERGLGVREDYQATTDLYRKAAAQGFAKAQYLLAVMYEYGRGVTQDRQAAAEWYSKAADQDYPKAQFYLDVMRGQQRDWGLRRDMNRDQKFTISDVRQMAKSLLYYPGDLWIYISTELLKGAELAEFFEVHKEERLYGNGWTLFISIFLWLFLYLMYWLLIKA